MPKRSIHSGGKVNNELNYGLSLGSKLKQLAHLSNKGNYLLLPVIKWSLFFIALIIFHFSIFLN